MAIKTIQGNSSLKETKNGMIFVKRKGKINSLIRIMKILLMLKIKR